MSAFQTPGSSCFISVQTLVQNDPISNLEHYLSDFKLRNMLRLQFMNELWVTLDWPWDCSLNNRYQMRIINVWWLCVSCSDALYSSMRCIYLVGISWTQNHQSILQNNKGRNTNDMHSPMIKLRQWRSVLWDAEIDHIEVPKKCSRHPDERP